MKRKLALIFTSLVISIMSMSALVLGPTQHAFAGQDYWSSDPCRPDVQWYNMTGTYGTFYSWGNYPLTFVGGRRMDAYTAAGWQCGSLGPPTSNFDANLGYQTFQYGQIYYDMLTGCYRVYLSYYGYSYGCY